jgi:hypothetical protein
MPYTAQSRFGVGIFLACGLFVKAHCLFCIAGQFSRKTIPIQLLGARLFTFL